jgi:xanthine dehydrogenase YagS FAD-binding subunit
MREFAYERAETVEAAVAAWDEDARYLAGGTNLVDLMKLGVELPQRLIDVGHLGLDTIEAGDGLRVGALVRNTDLANHPAAPPVLSQALLAGASGQLRNVATVAGNLLQRTRCSYFQDVTKPCNKRIPGSGCPAIEGDHRNLAVIGHTPNCVATQPSDMAVALVALGAAVQTDRRRIEVRDLYHEADAILEPGELITHIEIPPSQGPPSSYRKVRDRQSYAFAVVSLAVDGDRLVFGGLGPKPWRVHAEADLADAQPLRDNAFKLTIARNLLAGARSA